MSIMVATVFSLPFALSAAGLAAGLWCWLKGVPYIGEGRVPKRDLEDVEHAYLQARLTIGRLDSDLKEAEEERIRLITGPTYRSSTNRFGTLNLPEAGISAAEASRNIEDALKVMTDPTFHPTDRAEKAAVLAEMIDRKRLERRSQISRRFAREEGRGVSPMDVL